MGAEAVGVAVGVAGGGGRPPAPERHVDVSMRRVKRGGWAAQEPVCAIFSCATTCPWTFGNAVNFLMGHLSKVHGQCCKLPLVESRLLLRDSVTYHYFSVAVMLLFAPLPEFLKLSSLWFITK